MSPYHTGIQSQRNQNREVLQISNILEFWRIDEHIRCLRNTARRAPKLSWVKSPWNRHKYRQYPADFA